MKKVVLNILLILLIGTSLSAQSVRIGLFDKYQLKSVLISPVFGSYELTGDETFKMHLSNNSILYLTLVGKQIQVKSVNGVIGKFSKIDIQGTASFNTMRFKSDSPKLKAREYEDDFSIQLEKGKIQIVNTVNLENYIAGVVESEGGTKAEKEYYKTQSILCRTYALENFDKHKEEGFNLCDDVHCQAYKSRAKKSDLIVEATSLTKGLVIVDTSLSLITAAFYSNSGGRTSASEMIWSQPRSYLRSIVDTFSVGERNFKWVKSISFKQWVNFLKKNKFRLPSNITGYEFVFKDFQRKKYYKFKNDSVPYTEIRKAFGLRSSYFTISFENQQIIFNGRGYGHGVGLSQEGAMVMAKKGYNYKDIIKFYYRNVFIVSLRALQFFKD